ncbi:hypothetical protein [Undibacterium crateris]|uniref:hypothetical protein n=1 Tax=Undibacterium crateris TaxID=2528175 RepID=UPI0013894FC3|nr:hypothetical protein [Undibacterium crateris]NDI84298.1 hypothetical protein [Undibacterium crateris]
MKRSSFIFVLSLFSLFTLHAKAEDADPLWMKVIAQNNLIKKWVPKNVEQTLVITKSGEESKTIQIKKQYEKWDKGAPVYKLLNIEPALPAGAKPPLFDMAQMFATEAEPEVFSAKAKVKRSDGQTLNGKSVVVFETSQAQSKVRLWVDAINGAIYQRLLEISVPLTFEGSMLTEYVRSAEGNPVIRKSETDLSVLIPFKKAKMKSTDQYSDWFEHL